LSQKQPISTFEALAREFELTGGLIKDGRGPRRVPREEIWIGTACSPPVHGDRHLGAHALGHLDTDHRAILGRRTLGGSPPLSSRARGGRITGAPCSGNACPGWELLANNVETIFLRRDGMDIISFMSMVETSQYPCTRVLITANHCAAAVS
jgi:hypothetical protein